MAALLANPFELAVQLIIAWYAARKAATLLDASNRMMAVSVAVIAAVLGPALADDVVAAQLAGLGENTEGAGGLAMQAWALCAPLGFALIGVLGWCSYERS